MEMEVDNIVPGEPQGSVVSLGKQDSTVPSHPGDRAGTGGCYMLADLRCVSGHILITCLNSEHNSVLKNTCKLQAFYKSGIVIKPPPVLIPYKNR